MVVVLGIDVHKQTHTAVATDEVGRQLGQRTVRATDAGHRQLLGWALREYACAEELRFAVEDCRHVFTRLERALLTAGQQVVRVPPKLMAGARSSARTRGKSDPIDAVAIARAALREQDLPVASHDSTSREVKLLVDHREDLVKTRTQLQNRLLALPGCGALTAAKILGETADVARFRSEACFAKHAGVAPIPASSGKTHRHRLTRGGNRQLNAALHRIAVTQARLAGAGRDYYQRRLTMGNTKMEALRALKRRLARVVFTTLRTTTQPTTLPAAA